MGKLNFMEFEILDLQNISPLKPRTDHKLSSIAGPHVSNCNPLGCELLVLTSNDEELKAVQQPHKLTKPTCLPLVLASNDF